MGSFSGKQHTDEAIARIREGTQRYWTPERRAEVARRRRGLKSNGEPAVGHSIIWQYKPYRILHGQQGHPLAAPGGGLREHRKVLYDAVGPGPHECHWGCGRLMEWGGRQGIHADHLNGDTLDNRVENLVVSCPTCNKRRSKAGNPIDWRSNARF